MCVYFRGHRKGNRGKGTEGKGQREEVLIRGKGTRERELGKWTGLILLYISYL